MSKFHTLAMSGLLLFTAVVSFIAADFVPDRRGGGLDANDVVVIREAAADQAPRRQVILARETGRARQQKLAAASRLVQKGDLVIAPIDTLLDLGPGAIADLSRFDRTARAAGARLVVAYSRDADAERDSAVSPFLKEIRHRSAEAGLLFIPQSVARIVGSPHPSYWAHAEVD